MSLPFLRLSPNVLEYAKISFSLQIERLFQINSFAYFAQVSRSVTFYSPIVSLRFYQSLLFASLHHKHQRRQSHRQCERQHAPRG